MSSMDLRGALVVDDDQNTRELVAHILELEGCRDIFQAQSGADALKMLSDHGSRIEVMILDYMMPGMDGDEVLKRLRKVFVGQLGVVLISGNHVLEKLVGDHQDPDLHMAYVYKPFKAEDLLQRVETVWHSMNDTQQFSGGY